MGRLYDSVKLKIATVGLTQAEDQLVRNFCKERNLRVADPDHFDQLDPMVEKLTKTDSYNCLIIAPYKFDVHQSLSAIFAVRTGADHVTICLWGTRAELKDFPRVDAYWKDRLSHYLKYASDGDSTTQKEALDVVLDFVTADAVKYKVTQEYNTLYRVMKPATAIASDYASNKALRNILVGAIITALLSVSGFFLHRTFFRDTPQTILIQPDGTIQRF